MKKRQISRRNMSGVLFVCVLAICTSGAFANLVVNGDFEASSPAGWSGGFSTYNMTQAYYDGPAKAGGGVYGWAPNGGVGPSTQVIDITVTGGTFTFSGWLAGYLDDYGFLRLTFKDGESGTGATVGTVIKFDPWDASAGGKPLYWKGSANAAGVADAGVAHTAKNWSFFEATDALPAGAASAVLEWEGHVGGAIGAGGSTGNDAYADDISFSITGGDVVLPEAELGPVHVRFTDPHTAVVAWESTSDTDSIVEYGTESGSLGLRQHSTSSSSQHSVTLTGLQWRTKYYFKVGFTGSSTEVFSPTHWFDNAINFTVMDATAVSSPWPADGQTANYTTAASHILNTTNIRKGYALVYGIGDGRLLFELAKNSDLSVVGVDTDLVRVNAARVKLLEAGMYGTRVQVRHVADLSNLPFSKDFFNLVTSGRAVAEGALAGTSTETLRVVRPAGGRLLMGAPSGLDAATIEGWYAAGGQSITAVTDANGSWGDYARGQLANSGWWSHQYGTPANNGYAGESLGNATATSDLQLQWLGRPGSDTGIDRQVRMPAPVSANGRVFHQGFNRVMAIDSYNGSMLWSLEIPELRRVNIPRDTSNMCADDDGLYLAVKKECWKLDGDTGVKTIGYRIDEVGYEWGAVFRYNNLLIGSVVREGSHFLDWLGSANWYDQTSGSRTDKVCSKSMFALDPDTGSTAWGYTNGIIVEPTICMGNGRIYFMESRNATVIATGGGRMGPSLWQNLYLVALDANTGTVLWDTPVSPTVGTVATYLMYAPSDDRLVLSTSGTSYNVYTYNASSGAAGWAASHGWYANNHGGHMQRPVVIDDKVFMIPKLFNLSNGSVLNSSIGNTRSGCPAYSASTGALIYRSSGGNIGLQDLSTGAVSTWSRLRPSCWLNFTASGGAFLMPEGAGGCSCNGWINTSVGFSTKE